MTIGVIGAMEEEVAPLLAKFPDHSVHSVAGNNFYEIPYGGHEVIVAYSKIGKVHATLACSVMILKFGCEKVIFSGVAGGLRDDLEIGDLLMATSLCQHDVDITAFGHPLGFIPGSKIYFDSDLSLRNTAKSVAMEIGLNLKEGIVASGDCFICNKEKREWIATNFGAAAVEMEGASVALVCDSFDVPFCIFRSISDTANQDAGSSFDEFLVQSAEISANFVKSMVDRLILQSQVQQNGVQ